LVSHRLMPCFPSRAFRSGVTCLRPNGPASLVGVCRLGPSTTNQIVTMSDQSSKSLDEHLQQLPFLIAEGSEALQQTIIKILKEHGATNCIPIANGVDAWQVWKNSREIGMIIAEGALSEMSAVDLLMRVRADQMAKVQPVFLVMTGGDDSGLMAEAMKQGADGILSKPFTQEELMAMVVEGTLHRMQVGGADVFSQRVLENKILQSKLKAELIFERYRTEVECDQLTMENCVLVVDNNYGLGTVLNISFAQKTLGLEPFYRPLRGTVTKIERIPHEYGTFRVHVKFNGKPKEHHGIQELVESAPEQVEPA